MANITDNFLSFNQIASAILHGGHERTIIVEGPFGIGKTAIYNKLEADAKADPKHPLHNHIFTGVLDCTQLSDGSVWMPDVDRESGISRELPNERFGVHRRNQKGVNGSRPVVIMADEIAKAPQFVKNMLAPIFYERRVGNYYLPEGSLVWGATNMAMEGLGDSIQAHLLNRITTLKMRPPTMEEWMDNFAIPKRLNPTLLAAVNAMPRVFETFLDWEPGGKYHGKGQSVSTGNPYIHDPKAMRGAVCTPRSLHAASDWLHNCEGKVDDDTLTSLLAGTVGDAFTKDMMAYIRYGRETPSYEEVVKNPKTAKVPKNPTAQIVQVFQFVTQTTTREQADAVSTYSARMQEEMQALFASVVARSSAIQVFASAKQFQHMLTEQQKYLR